MPAPLTLQPQTILLRLSVLGRKGIGAATVLELPARILQLLRPDKQTSIRDNHACWISRIARRLRADMAQPSRDRRPRRIRGDCNSHRFDLGLFAAMAKRFHDINKSGLSSLLIFLPVAGLFTPLALLFYRGDAMDNKFGRPPFGSKIVCAKRLHLALSGNAG
jgi:hypothetical protein